MPGTLRVICVSDDAELAKTIRGALKARYPRVTVQTVISHQELARDASPDLIMWDQDQREQVLPAALAEIPTLLIRKHRGVSTPDSTLCEICVRSELTQPHFLPIVHQLLERRRLTRALIEAEQLLHERSMRDELTGRYNKPAFLELFSQAVKEANRYKTPLALLLVDLDQLRSFAAEHGQEAADLAIKQCSQLIQNTVREVDLVGRFERDLFAIGLPETEVQQAQTLADRLLRVLHQSNVGSSKPLPTASIGISGLKIMRESAKTLLIKAERALIAAKEAGGDRVMVADEAGTHENLSADEGRASEERFMQLRTAVIGCTAQAREDYFGQLIELFALNPVYATQIHPHAERVADLVNAHAQHLGWKGPDRKSLRRGALLHDVGLAVFGESLLTKTGPLALEEREMMQQHALIGARLLEPAAFMRQELAIVLHHHERFDGKGYPDHLEEQNIPMGARMVAIAEAWDRMTAPGSYRPTLTTAQAASELQTNAGHQFDPQLTDSFLAIVGA
jgi:diguanylate cyclase (GGDEF)-like protein